MAFQMALPIRGCAWLCSRRHRHDNEYGLDRVKQYLQAHAHEPLETIARGLVQHVRAHGAQLDDQTVLLIRRAAR